MTLPHTPTPPRMRKSRRIGGKFSKTQRNRRALPFDPVADEVRSSRRYATIEKVMGGEFGSAEAKVCQTLCGMLPMAKPIASDMVAGRYLEDHIRTGLQEVEKANGIKMAVRILRFALVKASTPEINLVPAQKAAKIPRDLGISSISRIKLLVVPYSDDPTGFAIQPTLEMIFFGRSLEQKMSHLDAFHRKHASAALLWTTTFIDPLDQKAIAAAVTAMMAPMTIHSRELSEEAQRQGITGWRTSAQLKHRRLVVLASNSMLPLDRQILATGGGRDISRSGFAAIKAQVSRYHRGYKPLLHNDAMPHFWFQSFQKLDLTEQKVPFIRLR
jgi:hypothetical protein